MRSAMWAAGSHEMTREPSGKVMTSCTACAVKVIARWGSWTAFGGAGVPGRDGGGRGRAVKAGIGPLDLVEGQHIGRGLAIDDDHVLELGEVAPRLEHRGQEGLLHHGHARARVPDEELDLGGRVGDVDR